MKMHSSCVMLRLFTNGASVPPLCGLVCYFPSYASFVLVSLLVSSILCFYLHEYRKISKRNLKRNFHPRKLDYKRVCAKMNLRKWDETMILLWILQHNPKQGWSTPQFFSLELFLDCFILLSYGPWFLCVKVKKQRPTSPSCWHLTKTQFWKRCNTPRWWEERKGSRL